MLDLRRLLAFGAISLCFLALVAVADPTDNGRNPDNDNDNEDVIVADGSTVVTRPSRIGGLFYPACRMTPPQIPTNLTFEYCPTAVVNGISVECRNYWMRQAMAVQFNGAGAQPVNTNCPSSFFGAIAVNHADITPTNHHDSQGNNCGAPVAQSSGKRGSSDDPTNHAETNVTRVIANNNRGHGRNRDFWGQFSLYTTGESCAGCANYQVFAGYKEIIYGVRIGAFILLGQGQTRITSLEVYRSGINWATPNPLVVIGQVMVEEQYPFFAWNGNVMNPNYPCPGPDPTIGTGTGCGVHPGTFNRCTNNPAPPS